jgi:ribonuclease P protein component
LLRPREFRHVFAQPIRFGDSLVTVLARDNGGSEARLGLAVARRRIPGAVERNLFKRIVRERFRIHRDRLGGHDIVVMPRPAAAGAGRAALRESIDRQWELLARRGSGSAHNRRPGEGTE